MVLWDVARREPLAVAKGGVGSVAFSLDGKTLAAGYDGGVVLWDVARREPLAVAEGGGRGVAFSPDGKTLAAGGSVGDHGGGVVLWDVVRTRAAGGPAAGRG